MATKMYFSPGSSGVDKLKPGRARCPTLVQLRDCFCRKMYTVETRIKEPTFLGDSLYKDLIVCLSNPYIRDGGSVSTVETRIKEPTFLGDSL